MARTRGARGKPTLHEGEEICDDATGDRYRVLALVGEGGMGRVFKAQHLKTGGIFALKCNQPIDAGNTTLAERMRREGTLLKKLRHRHIVPVLATGLTAEGITWMVMPLLDGASVGALLSVIPRIPLVWALEIARCICLALVEVHEHAIHRDIKPENVFVTRDGQILVLDFGAGKFYVVGRLTTEGTTLGTIQYMSPEQLQDPDGVDARSDLFAVGVMLFEMVAGKNPFDSDGPLRGHKIAIGHRIMSDPPRPLGPLAPQLPRYMIEVIGRLLEKDREDRNRDAAEVAMVLGAAQARLRSEHGEMPPIQRIFDGYDAFVRAREAPLMAARAPGQGEGEKPTSGARRKPGTELLVGYTPPPAARGATIPLASVGAPSVPVPAPESQPRSSGTAALDVRALAAAESVPEVEPAIEPAAARAAEAASGGEAARDDEAASGGEAARDDEPGLQPEAARDDEPGLQPEAARDDEPASDGEPVSDAEPLPGETAAQARARAREKAYESKTRKLLQAIDTVAEHDHPEAREELLRVLRGYDDYPIARAAAAAALARMGDESCLEDLEVRATYDPHPVVRCAAEEARSAILLRIGETEEAPIVASATEVVTDPAVLGFVAAEPPRAEGVTADAGAAAVVGLGPHDSRAIAAVAGLAPAPPRPRSQVAAWANELASRLSLPGSVAVSLLFGGLVMALGWALVQWFSKLWR